MVSAQEEHDNELYNFILLRLSQRTVVFLLDLEKRRFRARVSAFLIAVPEHHSHIVCLFILFYFILLSSTDVCMYVCMYVRCN